MFEESLIAKRRNRAAARFEEYNFLHQKAIESFKDRLSLIKRDFQTKAVLETLADVSSLGKFETLKTKENILQCEPNTYDLILSVGGLDTANDLPALLFQLRHALRPDGLFLGVLPGGETLKELRDVLAKIETRTRGGISPRIHPFLSMRQLSAQLQSSPLTLPVVDSEIITVTYQNPMRLFHDLRGMGATNGLTARDKTYPGRTFFEEACRTYNEDYALEDGSVPATFELIYIIGWAPPEN